MTRVRRAVIYCDADEGDCGSWDVDYYEETVSAVNGVPITSEARAPGWTSERDADFCPEHKEVNSYEQPARVADDRAQRSHPDSRPHD